VNYGVYITMINGLYRVENVKERHADVECNLRSVVTNWPRSFVIDTQYILFDAILIRIVTQVLIWIYLHYRFFAGFSRALVHLLLVLQS